VKKRLAAAKTRREMALVKTALAHRQRSGQALSKNSGWRWRYKAQAC